MFGGDLSSPPTPPFSSQKFSEIGAATTNNNIMKRNYHEISIRLFLIHLVHVLNITSSVSCMSSPRFVFSTLGRIICQSIR